MENIFQALIFTYPFFFGLDFLKTSDPPCLRTPATWFAVIEIFITVIFAAVVLPFNNDGLSFQKFPSFSVIEIGPI